MPNKNAPIGRGNTRKVQRTFDDEPQNPATVNGRLEIFGPCEQIVKLEELLCPAPGRSGSELVAKAFSLGSPDLGTGRVTHVRKQVLCVILQVQPEGIALSAFGTGNGGRTEFVAHNINVRSVRVSPVEQDFCHSQMSLAVRHHPV